MSVQGDELEVPVTI